MHHVVEVALVEQQAHALGHLVQPQVDALLHPVLLVGETQPEPGAHGRCHAALQASGQSAHGPDASGVHEPAVDDRLLVGAGVGV